MEMFHNRTAASGDPIAMDIDSGIMDMPYHQLSAMEGLHLIQEIMVMSKENDH